VRKARGTCERIHVIQRCQASRSSRPRSFAPWNPRTCVARSRRRGVVPPGADPDHLIEARGPASADGGFGAHCRIGTQVMCTTHSPLGSPYASGLFRAYAYRFHCCGSVIAAPTCKGSTTVRGCDRREEPANASTSFEDGKHHVRAHQRYSKMSGVTFLSPSHPRPLAPSFRRCWTASYLSGIVWRYQNSA
jgi:hypothetical protein